MPKNAFGDEVQTNEFGDTIVAEAPARVAAPAAPGALSRFDTFMRTPVALAGSPQTGAVMTGPEDPSGGMTPEQVAKVNPAVQEMAMRYGLPLAAGALAPVSGGASLGLAAAGGLTGEILAQKSEMDRGAREQASYGRMVAAPIMAGMPLGPAANLGVRAFGPAGRLLAVAPQAVVKRAAFGGLVGGAASGIEQGVDTGKIDAGELVNSAAFGSLFGAALGGLESAQATRAAKKTIFEMRKASGNFQGSDADFLLWAKAQTRRGAGPSMPAEEGAGVPQDQIQALPEGYSEPSVNNFGDPVAPAPVAPDNLTPDRSAVDRLLHTQKAASSNLAPAPIPQLPTENADQIPSSSPPVRDESGTAPAPEEVASGASGENLVAPEARIADASPQEENAILNPTAPPAPEAPAEPAPAPDLNAQIDQAATEAPAATPSTNAFGDTITPSASSVQPPTPPTTSQQPPEGVSSPTPESAGNVTEVSSEAGNVAPWKSAGMAGTELQMKRAAERQAALSPNLEYKAFRGESGTALGQRWVLHVRPVQAEVTPETIGPTESAAPTGDGLQKWLNVEEPNVSTQQERWKSNKAVVDALREEYQQAKVGADQIGKQIIKKTGYRTNEIKKTAPPALVKQYRALQAKQSEIENTINERLNASREDRIASNRATVRTLINNPSTPLLQRLAARMWLYNEENPKVGADHGELLDLWDKHAAEAVRQKFPDATREEINKLTPILEGVARTGNPSAAFELDPRLRLYDLRAHELGQKLKEANFDQWRYEAPDLNKEISRYTMAAPTKYAPSASQTKAEPLSRAKLDALIAEIPAAKEAVEKAKAESEKLEQELFESKSAKGIKVITESGVEAGPKAGYEHRVSKMADRKQLTVQREWIEKVLRAELPKAPDKSSIAPEFREHHEELQKLQKEWNAGKNVEGVKKRVLEIAGNYVKTVPASLQKDFGVLIGKMIKGIEGRMPAGTPRELILHVPGDGTYRMPYWKPTLELAIKRFKALGKNLGPVAIGTPSTSKRTIPKLPNGNVPPAEINKLLQEFTKNKDDMVSSLNEVRQEGAWTMASDGRTLILVRGGVGKSPGELTAKYGKDGLANVQNSLREQSQGLKWVDAEGNPKLTLGPGEVRTIKTDDLIKKLNAVIPAINENGKKSYVQLHFTSDGGVGVSYRDPSFGDYRSTNVVPGEPSRAAMNPYNLRDVLETLRKLGHEEIEVMPPIYDGEKRTGLVIKAGDKAAAIVMPVGEGGKALENAPETEEEKPAAQTPAPTPPPPSAPRGAAASPGMASAPPMGAPPPRMLRPVDNPDFSQFPIQLPEAVQFFRMLSSGKNPRIVDKIRTLHGTALGVFRYREGDIDSGRIELRADLFHLLSQQEKNALMQKAVAWAKLMKEANPDLNIGEAIRHKFEQLVKEAEAEAMKRDPARALATFWHEIGHYIDFLPEGTLRRGNLFGHLATLKGYLKNFIGNAPDIFPSPPTSAERAALQRKAQKEIEDSVKEITETITREEPIYKVSGITPKMVTEIVGQTARDDFPEFYDWFAQLSRADKVAVLKQAMRGIVDERAAKFGKREQVGTQTITEEVTRKTGEITPEAIAARYKELLREELKKRGLISLQDVKHELEGVIAWWHKSPTMPAYFRSGVEMYAETFSILANNPAALQARAPTWWSAFQQYMIRKPAIKAMYEQVQTDIKSGVIATQRVKNLRESWQADEKSGLERELSGEKVPWKQYKDSLNLLFNKQQGPIQALAAKQLGKPAANKLLSSLKDYLYRQTAIEGLARQINMHVEAPLASQDLNHADLSEYMFHQRIVAGDAVETANSQGWSPNTSTQRLQEMQNQLGPSRFATLGQANGALRQIYEAGPVKLLEASQTLKPELMKKIKENAAYSPFERAREAFNPLDEGTIRGMLEASYGETATARIFRRIGSFQDIKSPYVALVKKAEALTRFAYKQIAAKSFRDFKLQFDSDRIEQAPKSYNGHRLVPKDIDSPKVGTIYTLDNGELNGWYVPRAEYEAFEHASGTEQMLLGAALRFLSWPKAILTELNFGFWPVNFVRDLGAFGVQMKGGIGALKRLPQAYSAARATLTSKPNQVADQLLSRLMVISRADPRGEHLGHPDEMDRWLLRANKHPELWDAETKKIGFALRAWEAYKAQGQILERTTKALGMMHLDAKYGAAMPDTPGIQWVTMPEWMKKRAVNELAGSPDFNERGRGIAFVEVAGGPIFANAWLRGIESFYKAQKQDPAGVWTKFLLFFGMPALAFFAYEHGWNPPGTNPVKNEDERDMLRSIPERDKLRGWVKTLGWVDKSQKKVAYIVLPFPEQPRMFHAMLRKFMQTVGGDQGRKVGAGSMINYQGQDLPGQNPLINEAGKWWSFAVLGQNPYDAFRGKPVLDDKVFAAGQGTGELARQTLSNLSGNLIPPPQHVIPGDKPTGTENFLHKPGVSDLLGRWVRVSNAGVAEQDQAAVQPVQQRRAQIQIAGDEMIRKITAHELWTDSERQLLSVEPYLSSYLLDRFKAFQAGAGGPEVRDFMKGNNEDRAALLKLWMDRAAAKNARLQAAGVQP